MTKPALKKPADNNEVINGKSLNASVPTSPYILVMIDGAKNMPQGSEKSFEAPYLSLGRDSDCTISYGDDYPMVSRLHAAIEWSEDGYSLRHLSNTNQTLLNGRPIGRKWFLHDDDVIQLAPSGPKLKFKRPLILNMQPGKAKAREATPAVAGKKKDLIDNVALIAVIVLAILLATLMVYMTVSGS